MRDLPPAHPGEILHEELFSPLCISQHRLARDIIVPAMHTASFPSCPATGAAGMRQKINQ